MNQWVVLIAAVAMNIGVASSAQSIDSADTAARAADEALEAAVNILASEADEAADGGELVIADDLHSNGLWKPIFRNDPLIENFLADAEKHVEGNISDRQTVAAKYGLSIDALDKTIRLLRQMEEAGYDNEQDAALRARALQLVDTGERAPITLMIAAAVIGHVGDNCTAADVDLLMNGSRDRDADLWAIASSCTGSGALAIALERSTRARAALSYLAMNWTRADSASELAAVDTLLSPAFLALVDESQRGEVHADIARYKISALFNVGLLEEAIAFGDSLDPSILTEALTPDRAKILATIGGFTLSTDQYRHSAAADYAAALALAGRHAEARSVLDLVAPAKKRKQARACLDLGKAECGFERREEVPLSALIVDQFLEQPNADPYVLIEQRAISHEFGSGGVTEVWCRLLTRPDEQEECLSARESIASNRALRVQSDEADRALWAAIRRIGGEPFEMARSGYAAKLASLGAVKQAKRDWSRASVDPAPVQFQEHSLPMKVLAKKPFESSDPKSFGPLPEGFALVRVERSAPRAAAISVSQRFDPNGEVTAGGYWLHLSDDGGKSWQAPLYTGLAEYFPYVVPARARLQLLAGDRIQLEVEEKLIDTASISYPPVGMAFRRTRKDIYLDIPIAELRKDSDGDGLTDIAARHLLLDEPGIGGTPFVVGQERGCSAPSAETMARLEILKTIFQVEAQALIEPIGPTTELFGPWRQSAPSENPPIFLLGNPDHYKCVALDRPMIVYSDADRERLRKFSPDFQLIRLPPVRWNRDRTRGFVNWSMGWVGGTYRLIRNDDGWKLESISEWIT